MKTNAKIEVKRMELSEPFFDVKEWNITPGFYILKGRINASDKKESLSLFYKPGGSGSFPYLLETSSLDTNESDFLSFCGIEESEEEEERVQSSGSVSEEFVLRLVALTNKEKYSEVKL